MFDLNVSADFAKIHQGLREAERRQLPKATLRTLNKVMRTVQKEALRTMAKDMGVKQSEMRKYFRVFKPTLQNLETSIQATGRRVPLGKMGARQIKSGISYASGQGKRTKIPGAFIATMPSGHRGAFKRVGKKRLPIQELYGPSVPYVFIKGHIQAAMRKVAQQRWKKVFPHEVNFALQKAGFETTIRRTTATFIRDVVSERLH